jgi:hypothetical protein
VGTAVESPVRPPLEAPEDSTLSSLNMDDEVTCDGDEMPATHRLVLEPCNHSFLLCDQHTAEVQLMRDAWPVGKCGQCHAVTTIKSLEPL